MYWGHEVSQGSETVRVTRAEYNQSFGALVPEEPEIPDCAAHVWLLFWRLNSRRQSGESIQPISCSEVEAFLRLTGMSVTPEDFGLIEAMDNAFIGQCSEERAGQMERMREAQTQAAAPARGRR